MESRLQRAAARGRRATGAIEINMAIQEKLEGSGITQLRDFCQDVPSKSQIAETRHFLNTKVLDLLQKVELWCNARDASENRRQAPVGRLDELQVRLRRVSFLYPT